MKNVFIILTATALLFCSSAFRMLQAGGESLFPPMEKYRLKNGLEVIFIDFGNLPVTSINVYINTGRKNETPGLQSIASLTASALLLGNEKWDRIAQDNMLFKMGSSISASSNDTYTQVNVDYLNKDIDKGVELLAAVLLSPKFPKEDIAVMLRQQIDYNNPKKMDIEKLASVFSGNFVFGTANPLGRYFYATQLGKINRDSISMFYQFNYTPKNTKLVISGKPEREKMKKLIEQYFGNWKAAFGEVNGVSYEQPALKTREYGFINKTKAPQTALQWNKKAPEAKSKDLIPFQLANSVFNDLLFKEIREKDGYTYGIRSTFSSSDNNGIYEITTLVRSEVMYAAVSEFDRVLKQFYDKGLTEEELKVAKTRMRGNILSMESPGQMVSFINPMLYPDYEKRKQYLNEIEQLSLAEVNKMVKKYFNPDAYKLVISGDETVLEGQLGKINGLKRFDPKQIELNN